MSEPSSRQFLCDLDKKLWSAADRPRIAVDAAIALFSGEKTGQQAREIWLVDPAPKVIQKLETAVQKLDGFMKSQGVECTPSAVANLKGDAAKTHQKGLMQQLFPSPDTRQIST